MKTTASVQPGGHGKTKQALRNTLPLTDSFTGKTAFLFTRTAAATRQAQPQNLIEAFAGKGKAAKQNSSATAQERKSGASAQRQTLSASPRAKKPARQRRNKSAPGKPAALCRAFDGARHEDEMRFYGDLAHVLSALLALENGETARSKNFCAADEPARRLLMKMMRPGKAYLSNRFKARARSLANRRNKRAEIRIRTHKMHKDKKHRHQNRPLSAAMLLPPPAPQPRHA